MEVSITLRKLPASKYVNIYIYIYIGIDNKNVRDHVI